MMKRARSYSEGSKRYLSSDPESILQYLDEIISDEDTGSEFEGYVTEDDNLEDDDNATTTRFSQNTRTHTSYDDATHTATDYNTRSCQSKSLLELLQLTSSLLLLYYYSISKSYCAGMIAKEIQMSLVCRKHCFFAFGKLHHNTLKWLPS